MLLVVLCFVPRSKWPDLEITTQYIHREGNIHDNYIQYYPPSSKEIVCQSVSRFLLFPNSFETAKPIELKFSGKIFL